MNYDIKAIETRYNGVNFRSRLEAKWAAMFDLLGWRWDYEPIDFNGWIPDFAIYGKYAPTFVEIKPVVAFPEDIAIKMWSSGCQDEMLLLGMTCPIDSDFYGIAFGWHCDRQWVEGEACWESAVFGKWIEGQGQIGFCNSSYWYQDRISGGYDGGHFGAMSVHPHKILQHQILQLWREAGNISRWNHKN